MLAELEVGSRSSGVDVANSENSKRLARVATEPDSRNALPKQRSQLAAKSGESFQQIQNGLKCVTKWNAPIFDPAVMRVRFG